MLICILICLLSFAPELVNGAAPTSVVLDLNDKFIDVKDDGMWLVKFYAPWCAHCKRLAPTWEHLGHALQDKNLPIRVAKMDCTRFNAACNSLDVKGYPTIIFFRNGRKIEFHGDRTKEALVNFCIKSYSPLIENVNAVKLGELRRDYSNDPVFVLIGEKEDGFRQEFEKVAESLLSKTRFFSARVESVPAALKTSRIAVFKDEHHIAYTGDVEGLKEWVFQERWPMLPKASPSSISDIATNKKLLVLCIVTEMDRYNKSSSIGIFFDKVNKAAAELRKNKVLDEMFQFAWVDGPEMTSSIVMGAMTTPGMLVFNYSAYEYFLSLDEAEHMTPQSIVEWLEGLADSINKGLAVPMGGRSWPIRVRRIGYEIYSNVIQMFATQPLLSACLFGVPIAFFSIICYSICSADFTVDREEFYPDDEEEYEEDPDHEKHE
ncbi:unnamed protein product [Auanema sp. JU1783]|nr:unnamed protein product [Auanema sp. JU1783]